MYIDLETVKATAALFTSLTVIGGALIALYKFYLRQKKQDDELSEISKELQLVCFGLRACLSAHHEQGCNGPVTEALSRLDKHLNEKAHRGGGLP